MNCLNCNTELTDKYCPHCGQKASTHRFSLKYLFTVDFFHSFFHLNKGFLYTLNALFTCPGHSIREYVQGKRILHFNYFALLFTIQTAMVIFDQFFPLTLSDVVDKDMQEMQAAMESFINANTRLYIFAMVPFYALFSFLFFKKGKQNYAEHLVLNTYALSAQMISNLVFSILTFFNKGVFQILSYGNSLVVLVYAVWFYYQYFAPFYKKKTPLLFRCLVVNVIAFICYYLVLGFILGLKMSFGNAS
jgi:hypothetical protein